MVVSFLLPWPLRRLYLQACFKYQIHSTSHIGFAWILPKKLIMDEYSRIGHLTICKNLELVRLKRNASIGKGNWITGFPSGSQKHFIHQKDRNPQLILGEHSAITHRHLIDCTNSVVIGNFTTFAGFQSQILTHSVDFERSRQSSSPVTIGNYCFISTNSVILGGSVLPDYSVLGAKSLLNKNYLETYFLYGGVPARPIKRLPKEYSYFSRSVGFVN